MELIKGECHTANNVIHSYRCSGRMDDERQARWLSGPDKESGAAVCARTDDGDVSARSKQLFPCQIEVLPELDVSLQRN